MMTPRHRGPLPGLLAEKRIAAEPAEGGYRITCLTCGAQWQPALRSDGRLQSYYWRCPNGCNAAPAEGDEGAELPPVHDLAGLPAVLTTDEVAAVLRLHPVTVKAMLRAGELPGRKIGGQWRILKADLLAYLGAEG